MLILNDSPSVPVQGRAHPIPDAFSPAPKAATVPSPKTTEQAAIDKQSQKIDDQGSAIADLTKQFITIGGILAGLTPIVQGIPDAIAKSPTVRAGNRGQILGCTSSMMIE